MNEQIENGVLNTAVEELLKWAVHIITCHIIVFRERITRLNFESLI